MSLKKLLWSDKADELFSRKTGRTLLTQERLEAVRAAADKHGPTLKAAGRDAAAGFKAAMMGLGVIAGAAANSYSASSNKESNRSAASIEDYDMDVIKDGFHASGPEGPGYYEGGFKLRD